MSKVKLFATTEAVKPPPAPPKKKPVEDVIPPRVAAPSISDPFSDEMRTSVSEPDETGPPGADSAGSVPMSGLGIQVCDGFDRWVAVAAYSSLPQITNVTPTLKTLKVRFSRGKY